MKSQLRDEVVHVRGHVRFLCGYTETFCGRGRRGNDIYGFCTFLSFRCYEQLKFSLASHKSNTKIVGIGPGYSFSNDGPTHHGIQDLYLMYLIPEGFNFSLYNDLHILNSEVLLAEKTKKKFSDDKDRVLTNLINELTILRDKVSL